MADLFVSYSRADKPRAAEIVSWLEGNGWDVFWDQETRAGTLWPKVLEEELNSARCLLALWTTTSIDSRWVRIEAYEALQSEKLVPVLLDKVRPPLEFRQTQMFDLIGWNGDQSDPRLAHLLADLTALLKAPALREHKSRPIRLVVPATLQEQISETTADSGVDGTSKSQTGTTIGRSYKAMLAVGAAVAVAAVTWLIVTGDPSPAPVPSATLQPTVAPASVAPTAVAPTTAAPALPVVESPPVATTKVATGPVTTNTVKPAIKPAPKSRSLRCTTIEEKFQQTGQITATERDLLRSKECQS